MSAMKKTRTSVRIGQAAKTVGSAGESGAALRLHLDQQLSERDWQAQVVRLARSLNWVVWHPQISVWSKGGWPDLVLLKPPRALFWELKTERGKVQPAQEHMLSLLAECGLTAAVVRPGDREWVHRQLMGETA